MLTMLTMHIFGILRLWRFQNIQFCPKLIRFWRLVTLYRFFLLLKIFTSWGFFLTPQTLLRMVPLHNKIHFSSQNSAKNFGHFWPKMGFYRKMVLWPGNKNSAVKSYYAKGSLGTFFCFIEKSAYVVKSSSLFSDQNGRNGKNWSKVPGSSPGRGKNPFFSTFIL